MSREWDRSPRNPKPCSVEGCGGVARSRGWCVLHYNRWRTTGTVELLPRGEGPRCSVQGCHRVATHGGGLCRRHYQEARAKRVGACSIDGCSNPISHLNRGLCDMHNERLRVTGDTGGVESRRQGRPRPVVPCRICGEPQHAKGLCMTHYGQQWRNKKR